VRLVLVGPPGAGKGTQAEFIAAHLAVPKISITFNPTEVADNMRKFGGFVPGIRPGRPTAEYLGYILSRITLPGSIYLGIIAVLPNLFISLLDDGGNNTQNFPFGGTAVLIIVGVGLETVKQIESQLMQRNYEGFLR
jgi:preprotein translocase subunit SecY